MGATEPEAKSEGHPNPNGLIIKAQAARRNGKGGQPRATMRSRGCKEDGVLATRLKAIPNGFLTV